MRRPSALLSELNANAQRVAWERSHKTEHLFEKRGDLHSHVAALIGSEPIDYLEFGVFKGESIFSWAKLSVDPDSRFFGFDSFRGLPEPWNRLGETLPEGHFDVGGMPPETEDSRIRFIKGKFQDVLPAFMNDYEPHNRIVVHHDSDLYSSTLYCLTQLDQVLPTGSILIFDEFFVASHEFQAWFDYARAYGCDGSVIAAVGSNPYSVVALALQKTIGAK